MMTLALHEGNPGHHLQASYLLAMGKVIPDGLTFYFSSKLHVPSIPISGCA